MPSPLQDTLFLLLMEPERPAPLRDAAAALPRSLAEFFSIVGEIPLGQDGFPRTVWNEGGGSPAVGEVTDDYWIVGLPDLLADYWAADVTSLATFLEPGVCTDPAATDDVDTESITELPPGPMRGPLRLLFTNETRDGRAFVELDGSDDPPVHEHFASTGWDTPRPFSAWLFTLFADGYVFHDWAPSSFWGPNADLARSEVKAPLQLFKSGLWLRAHGPLTDDARAALVAEFSEHDVRPYDDSALEQFIDDDAAIWIVGATYWWLWADNTAALARIATVARTHGELGAFIADTRDARTVLADLG
ncbi:hypothetical protein [Nocardia noduli]|uniref:hypothetical protein n=1 Tax=Nocardia noduli TaxID=2815722 RepID=UPI001C22B15B|nr:hypothetical protein [Nocardia noduli]